jgi:hypothetical protein
MAYGCPTCGRIVPLDEVNLDARTLRCESCGKVHAFADPAEVWRDAPPPPPPPVEIFGVPASVDIRQPGDGTIEFRIDHWQRRVHAIEMFIVSQWTVASGVVGFWCMRTGRWVGAAVAVTLAIPAMRHLATLIWTRRRRTVVHWDRVTGIVRAWAELDGQLDGEERTASLRDAKLAIRRSDAGIQLVAADASADRPLADDLPVRMAEWLATTTLAIRSGDKAREQA